MQSRQLKENLFMTFTIIVVMPKKFFIKCAKKIFIKLILANIYFTV
jgi:hypothetical protein